jgi:hypothetical protein
MRDGREVGRQVGDVPADRLRGWITTIVTDVA